ncbi:MAG: (Fe-S)-binding protein [Bacillota bacterium]
MFRLTDLARAQVDTCVHCGLCAEACPTYRELGIEDDSPRGRIHLIRHLHTGELEPTPKVLEHLDLCLACRACETACPSGVKYGAIIEEARGQLERTRRRPFLQAQLRRLLFRGFLPRPARLRLLARGLRLSQRLGLDRLAIRLGLVQGPLAEMAQVARVPDRFGSDLLPERVPPVGPKRFTVAFVQGCVTDVLFGPTNLASVRVLAANGCEVLIPRAQSCCGGLALHSGDREIARAQARQNIDALLDCGAEYILINAAGCGSTLKEYHHLLADDPVYAERAHRFAAMVRDITEFLGSIDLVPPPHPVPLRVTYQDACHLAHGQGIRLQPRQLLAQIPGLELVSLPESDACCGSAGIYNLVQAEMAQAVLRRKMEQVAATGAAVVASANAGCILQLRLGARQRGLPLEVLHVIDLLDRAYGGETEGGAARG